MLSTTVIKKSKLTKSGARPTKVLLLHNFVDKFLILPATKKKINRILPVHPPPKPLLATPKLQK